MNAEQAYRAEAKTPGEVGKLLLPTLAWLVAFFLVIALCAAHYRQPLSALGSWFVGRFGIWGMALLTYLADGFSVPTPPQVALFFGIVGGVDPRAAVGVVSVASILGGHTGYHLAGAVVRRGLLPKRSALALGRAQGVLANGSSAGYVAIVILALSPIPYSLICYVAGMSKMPYRFFAPFTLLRVPRMVFFYLLIRSGWGGTGS